MKKLTALFLALACVLALAGCDRQDEAASAPTGYPTGSIQQPQIMYNGRIYYYFATGFDEPLPDGFAFVGGISSVDHDSAPVENLQGARVEPEQAVYASEASADIIYVKYQKGYAKFVVKEEEESSNKVVQFFEDKYSMKFQLWGPEGHDLYAFHIYPDHAEWECHILMQENTDDIEQYQKDLSWKVVGEELIILGAGSQETFRIDIAAETATSTTTGRVYQIYAMEQPQE
jgi:hypothetical protein